MWSTMALVAAILCMAVARDGGKSNEGRGPHLFILAGQSNMLRLHPEEAFAPAVFTALGKQNVVIVQDAAPGQPIQRWTKSRKVEPSEKVGDLYDQLMTKVLLAIAAEPPRSVTFVWMQGERDAKLHRAAGYSDALAALYAQLSQDLGRDDINVVIGRLSDFDLTNAQWVQIRSVQVRFAESNSRFAWVNTDDLNDGVTRGGEVIHNGLHYSAEGYKELGERFAESALSLLYSYHWD